MEDFGSFFKLGNIILTSPNVPGTRSVLIEAFHEVEERGGNVKVFYDVYTPTANRSKEGLSPKEVRDAITTIQDDGRILKKIVEILVIPLFP
jgi:hypothetical protein